MSKLRKSAKGRECQVRIPGVCNHNPETVVLAHINGAGMGIKANDIHAAFCCSSCHDALDGRNRSSGLNPDLLRLYHLDGVIRTQRVWLNEGLI